MRWDPPRRADAAGAGECEIGPRAAQERRESKDRNVSLGAVCSDWSRDELS